MASINSHFVSEKSLLIFRIVAAILVSVYWAFRVGRQGGLYFYYMTNWNWNLNFVYFPLAMIRSLGFNPPHFDLTLRILYAMLQPISLLVFFVYWALLSGIIFAPDTSLEDRIVGFCSHFFNLVFPMTELFLTTTVLEWKEVVYPVTVLFFYAVSALIFKAVDPSLYWPYDFMKVFSASDGSLKWGFVVLFFIGFGALVSVFFAIIKLVINFRERRARASQKSKIPSQSMVELNSK